MKYKIVLYQQQQEISVWAGFELINFGLNNLVITWFYLTNFGPVN